MALVTETTLREQYGDNMTPSIACYEVPSGTVVTPAAKAWLIDRKIDLMIGTKLVISIARGTSAGLESGTTRPVSPDPLPAPVTPPLAQTTAQAPTPTSPADSPASALPAFTKPERFDVVDGSQLADKPEHLTALRGNLLVPKDHPEIRFRGGLDSYEADILMAQITCTRLGLPGAVAELGDVLRFVKQLLRAEVLDEPFPPIQLFSLTDEELRYRSHHPSEFFGIPHFATSVEDGEVVVVLNQLRTRARHLELLAYDAYAVGGTKEPSRLDIIRALNRLSSAIYLMMFKAKSGGYSS